MGCDQSVQLRNDKHNLSNNQLSKEGTATKINTIPQISAKQAIQNSEIQSKPNIELTNISEEEQSKQYLKNLIQFIQQQEYLRKFIGKQPFQHLKNQIKKTYWHVDKIKQVINCLEDYIIFNNIQTPLKQNQNQQKRQEKIKNYIGQYSQKIFNITNQNNLRNYWLLKSTKFSQQFYKYKFDLSVEEFDMLTDKVRMLCNQQMSSIFYLSLYLVKCCQKMQKQNKNIQQINIKLKQQAQRMKNKYSVEQKRKQQTLNKQNQNEKISQFLKKQLQSISKQKLSNKIINITSQKKEQQIQGQIMKMVQFAKQNHSLFDRILYQPCIQSHGFEYKSNLKLTSKQNKSSLVRVKQKLLKNKLQKSKQKKIYQNILDLIKGENLAMEEAIKQAYEKSSQIQFTVSDLLRGKCIFYQINYIYETAQKIIGKVKSEKLKGRNIQIVQVDNRLKKLTQDLVFKIKIDDLVCQFQMVLFFKQTQNSIHHKMYEMIRSKILSPITLLYEWNEKALKNYYKNIKKYIDFTQNKQNISSMKKMLEFTNLKQIDNDLKVKFNIINKRINFDELKKHQNYKQQNNRKSIQMRIGNLIMYFAINQEKELLQKFVQQNEVIKLQKDDMLRVLLQIANYKCKQGIYQEAIQNYNKCLTIYQKQKQKNNKICANINQKLGFIFNKKGLYPKSLQYYKVCLDVYQKQIGKDSIEYAGVLNYMGLVYLNFARYKESQQYLFNSLKIYQKTKGSDSIECTKALDNIGIFKNKLGNYSEALQILNKSLSIKEHMKGKDNQDWALTCRLIGNTYKNQRNYLQAYQYYRKTLNVIQSIYGQESIQSVLPLKTIGDVLVSQGLHIKSLSYFRKALSLQQKIKGKDCIDSAHTLNSLGVAYLKSNSTTQALTCHNKALKIQQTIKGKDNIDCAYTYLFIGHFFFLREFCDKGRENYQKSLKIQQNIKGLQTIDCADLYVNIGNTYKAQKNYEKALQLYYKALTIYENILGKNCTLSAVVLYNIGYLQQGKGNRDLAIQFYTKSHQIFMKMKGDPHTHKRIISDLIQLQKSKGNKQIVEDLKSKLKIIQENLKQKVK